jgi:lysylphosphatidylglycerol synthetase-like protein (DUF2156 family)
VFLDLLPYFLLVSVAFLQVLTVGASLAASQVWALQAVLVFLVSVLGLVLLAEKALAYSVVLALVSALVSVLASVGDLGLVLRFALFPPALSTGADPCSESDTCPSPAGAVSSTVPAVLLLSLSCAAVSDVWATIVPSDATTAAETGTPAKSCPQTKRSATPFCECFIGDFLSLLFSLNNLYQKNMLSSK